MSPRQLKEELSFDGGASWTQPNDTVVTNINELADPDAAYTFPVFADQDGSANNHVNTIDVCYANC
jgi:hypothetical protein